MTALQRHEDRVRRFESLLRPFASSPTEGGPASSSKNNHSARPDVGELPPAHGRGPRSAEAWRKEELRKLCSDGIPDEPKQLRAAAYRFLLSLDEPPALASQYSAFVDDINAHLDSLYDPATPDDAARKVDKLLKEIEQDVDRTFGALAWFGTEEERQNDALWLRLDRLAEVRNGDPAATEPESSSATNGSTEAVDSRDLSMAEDRQPAETASSSRSRSRRRILTRPLFLYAYLNPGVSFVQGMSYIAAVFIYVFAQAPPAPRSESPPAESAADLLLEAEASTFFALSALLSQLRDLFVPALDGLSPGGGAAGAPTTVAGIGSASNRFRALLLAIDATAANALERKGIDLRGFVVRWLTTLFANEFPLPDVLRVWDRILSFYPLAGEQPTAEALSPVLGHLIDLALAVVELERANIISPFAKAPKILSRLQDLQIEGEGVDKLLREAWSIRERRLGRAPRPGASPTPSKSASGFGRMFGWSPSAASKGVPSSASDFEVDDQSSVAGSETSKPAGHRFGSLAFSSPRSSQADLAENVTVVEGKVLPPPPARVDQHVTIASLIEAELRDAGKQVEEPEYGIENEDDDDEGAKEGPAMHRRMASGWGGLKASFSRFAASDTAAELAKRATNMQIAAAQSALSASSRLQTSDAAAAFARAQTNAAIRAQLLREQLAEQAPDRLARIREAAAGATGRLSASTDSERGGSQHSPGSPREAPFVPPGMGGDRDVPPLGSPRGESADMARTASGGPKPLLLSASARRAQNGSEDYGSDRGSSISQTRSPASSPTLSRSDRLLSPDFSVPPLSRSPSRGGHGQSASNWDTPTRATASDFRPRSGSIHSTPASPLDDQDSPIVSRRLQDATSMIRRGVPTSRLREDESPSPAQAPGHPSERRGWQLTDEPVSAPPGPDSAGSELGFDPSTFGREEEEERARPSGARPILDDGLEAEAPFMPPTMTSEVEHRAPTRAPRGSSLSGSHRFADASNAEPPAALEPSAAAEEAADTTPLVANPSLSRSKVVRRPISSGPGRKRTSRSSSSTVGAGAGPGTGSSVDWTGPEARRVASEFLTRSASGSGAGHRRRASEAARAGVEPAGRSGGDVVASSGVGGYGGDEDDLLDAYGDSEVLREDSTVP